MLQYEGKMYCDNRDEWSRVDSRRAHRSPSLFGSEHGQGDINGRREKKRRRRGYSSGNSSGNESGDCHEKEALHSRRGRGSKCSSSSRSRGRSIPRIECKRTSDRISISPSRRPIRPKFDRETSAKHGFRESRSRQRRGNAERPSWKKGSEKSASPVYDSEEEYRRSRSREKARRKKQYETIQKYCRNSGESQVFWDGFQWVKKGEGNTCTYDQQMNSTRRARRLHVGNLPLNSDVTEDDFKSFLWKLMKERKLCSSSNCPILHVWFARDRGGSYGFVEMNSVEEAHAVLSLDGFKWNGASIRINRPSDWKKYVNDSTFGAIADSSGLALAEGLAAAAQQAISTGNTSGLASLISKLPAEQQQSVADLIQQQQIAANQAVQLPMELVQCQIETELLKGSESKVIRIIKPTQDTDSEENFDEILQDIMTECKKFGGILAALIIRPKLEREVPTAETGDVYFEYATSKQADAAIIGLSGRIYDGRPLEIERFNEVAWSQSFKCHSENILGKILLEHDTVS